MGKRLEVKNAVSQGNSGGVYHSSLARMTANASEENAENSTRHRLLDRTGLNLRRHTWDQAKPCYAPKHNTRCSCACAGHFYGETYHHSRGHKAVHYRQGKHQASDSGTPCVGRNVRRVRSQTAHTTIAH